MIRNLGQELLREFQALCWPSAIADSPRFTAIKWSPSLLCPFSVGIPHKTYVVCYCGDTHSDGPDLIDWMRPNHLSMIALVTRAMNRREFTYTRFDILFSQSYETGFTS